MKIKNPFTGIVADYIPWDGISGMGPGRAAYACPVCTGLIVGSLEKPMAHPECFDRLAKEREFDTANKD